MMQHVIDEILSVIRELNSDPFRPQLTSGNSPEDALTELLFYYKNHLANKEKTNDIIEHILNFNIGDFSKSLPISDQQSELDVICMGLNTFAEELRDNAVSIKAFDNVFNSLESPFFIVDTAEKALTKYNNSTLRFFNYNESNKFHIPVEKILDETIVSEIKKFDAGNNKTTSLRHSFERNQQLTHAVFNLSKLDTAYYSTPSISVFITDITAQVENEKLLKAKEVSEHSARMKEEFLANMSHEIRTPMNAIIGLSKLMNKAGNLNEKQNEYMRVINLNSHNLLSIINNILDYSKIEAGKIELEERPFEIHKETLATSESLAHNIIDKGLMFEVIIDEKLPKFLIGDSSRLNQILINLLANAIKFTERGKITLAVTLEKLEDKKAAVKFLVRDSGIGIPVNKQSQIFESFTQASSATTRKYGGTGLGLSIVKKLVDLHHSSIVLKSKTGEGSEFSFVFNYFVGAAEDTEKTIYSSFRNQEEMSIDNLRILLVEDNAFNQMVATDTILDWNPTIQIDIAGNGIEAMEKLKKNSYDLILMDIQMPEMDGHITTKIIRNEFEEPARSLPIIAMTAHALVHEVEACFKNGMTDYISKPFEPEALFNKISRAIHPDFMEGSKNYSDFSWQRQKNKIVDTDSLYSFTKGNKERISKMIHIFLDETPQEIIKLSDYFKRGDYKALKALAHSLKPKMTYMGIPELSEIAYQLEQHADNKKESAKLIHTLTEKTEVAIKELKEILLSC
ncbi:MAG: ATP-binding protein [Flavobacteriales bacterium]